MGAGLKWCRIEDPRARDLTPAGELKVTLRGTDAKPCELRHTCLKLQASLSGDHRLPDQRRARVDVAGICAGCCAAVLVGPGFADEPFEPDDVSDPEVATFAA